MYLIYFHVFNLFMHEKSYLVRRRDPVLIYRDLIRQIPPNLRKLSYNYMEIPQIPRFRSDSGKSAKSGSLVVIHLLRSNFYLEKAEGL